MRVTAVGSGKLGLPWSLIADAAGHDVIGVNLDAERVEVINRRRVSSGGPGVAEMLANAHCRLRATSSRLGDENYT